MRSFTRWWITWSLLKAKNLEYLGMRNLVKLGIHEKVDLIKLEDLRIFMKIRTHLQSIECFEAHWKPRNLEHLWMRNIAKLVERHGNLNTWESGIFWKLLKGKENAEKTIVIKLEHLRILYKHWSYLRSIEFCEACWTPRDLEYMGMRNLVKLGIHEKLDCYQTGRLKNLL